MGAGGQMKFRGGMLEPGEAQHQSPTREYILLSHLTDHQGTKMHVTRPPTPAAGAQEGRGGEGGGGEGKKEGKGRGGEEGRREGRKRQEEGRRKVGTRSRYN